MKTIKIVKSILVATSIFIGSVSFAQNNAGDMLKLADAIQGELKGNKQAKGKDGRSKTEASVSSSPYNDYQVNKRFITSRERIGIAKKSGKAPKYKCSEVAKTDECQSSNRNK